MQETPWQDRPLVQRRYRKVVAEPLGPTGEVLTELDEHQVTEAIGELRAAGVESIAVCFLFSHVNPGHEDRGKAMIETMYPEAFVTTSASIFPQFREFERFTIAAINAFIGPKVKRYVNKLANRIKEEGLGSKLHIVRSNGGVATTRIATEKPVTLLLSGPAAGILGDAWTAKFDRRDHVITFDVGGTSADIGIVTPRGISEASAQYLDRRISGHGTDSRRPHHRRWAVAVLPTWMLAVPFALAGADPGPACYGLTGEEPTVTDANVVLGHLDATHFLGGDKTVYPEKAHGVIQALADRLNLDPHETAEGILTVLNNNMANAIRSRTIQKGYDPRDFTLVAFGGTGPLHAAEVAASMGIPEVLIPPYPGITAAMGLLTTDLRYDEIRNQFMLNVNVDLEKLNADLTALEHIVRQQLLTDGVPEADIKTERGADCRYVGQGYELRAYIPDGQVTADNIHVTWDSFHQIHKEEYGHRFLDHPIELVSLPCSWRRQNAKAPFVLHRSARPRWFRRISQ